MKFIDIHHHQWHHVVGEDGPMPCPDPAKNCLLTLEQWHAVRDHWPAGLVTAVELPNDVDIESLAADLPRLSMVALSFPKWVDGRAYTQAHLLRSRYRFTGEVRATGEVLVDMLPLLARCGFDAVQMRADQSQAAAERALGFFPAHYQGDVDATQPVFAREAA
jgi:uncharacterized protein (DUF934 family)